MVRKRENRSRCGADRKTTVDDDCESTQSALNSKKRGRCAKVSRARECQATILVEFRAFENVFDTCRRVAISRRRRRLAISAQTLSQKNVRQKMRAKNARRSSRQSKSEICGEWRLCFWRRRPNVTSVKKWRRPLFRRCQTLPKRCGSSPL